MYKALRRCKGCGARKCCLRAGDEDLGRVLAADAEAERNADGEAGQHELDARRDAVHM
jgi:hypothetical protein